MVKLGNNNPLLGLAVGDALGYTLEFKITLLPFVGEMVVQLMKDENY